MADFSGWEPLRHLLSIRLAAKEYDMNAGFGKIGPGPFCHGRSENKTSCLR